ncbi:MAG: hypothetical protein ACE5EM_09460 [Sphingomonadales bacterium]
MTRLKAAPSLAFLAILLACEPGASQQAHDSRQAALATDTGNGALSALEAISGRMTPGRWSQIPNSSISTVLATRDQAPENGGINGPRGVIDSWNGAAYDNNRHHWYFHGGGHQDYSGNEVYRFDFTSLKWTRLTEPSPLVDTSLDSCRLPQDGPPSIHTYDGLIYAPTTDTIWYFTRRGGYCRKRAPTARRTKAPARVWEFNLVTLTWTEHFPYTADGFVYTAFDKVTGEILVIGDREITAFNPSTKTFQPPLRSGRPGDGSGFMDEKRRRFVQLSRQGLTYIDRSRGRFGPIIELISHKGLTARTGVGNCFQGGIDHDTKRDLYVMWCGESDVYAIDPDTLDFKTFEDTAASPVASKASHRIYSKWIYIKESDVFAGYNNHKGNVLLYRLPEH